MLQNPHTHAALPEVLEKLRSAAALDFDQAHPIPAAVNHSLAFHDLEQQVLFQQEWICVGRADEIPHAGVFPNHLITLMPDYLWYISVQPCGTDKMRASWGLAVPPEVIADVKAEDRQTYVDDFRRYLMVANGEDKALVEALHRGSSSPLLPRGTFHPIERNLWPFMRYLARRCEV